MPFPLSTLILYFQLKHLSGHRRAKNNPHLPTTQEKTFEVVGVFPLPSSPPTNLSRHCILNLEGTNFKGRKRRDRTEGEDWRQRDTERAEEWKRKTSRRKSEKESKMANCCFTPLYHFTHLSSSLPVFYFYRSIHSPSAVRNKASKQIKLMETFGKTRLWSN